MEEKEDNTKYIEMQNLKSQIMSLTTTDWECICKSILIPSDEKKITITKRGVFFCLMNLSDEAIEKLKEYIGHKNRLTFK